ncbi:Flp family type IVb pilin [Paludisphaera mucosa]|uniref:Flp family type IVb pilin n=1 Tax=Paludisphaera mucosa TaxID=3030827 RepID=A0ABT6FB73_9BACT|nr:hypothetical protein [Paludisphaera mucosa]MDG3004751.1 hypothetical protein [Paludisphaera mucosa]
MNALKRLAFEVDGATMIEYAMTIGFVAAAVVLGATELGVSLASSLQRMAETLR